MKQVAVLLSFLFQLSIAGYAQDRAGSRGLLNQMEQLVERKDYFGLNEEFKNHQSELETVRNRLFAGETQNGNAECDRTAAKRKIRQRNAG